MTVLTTEISSGDDAVDYTVHLRVHGMMCQRNCGTTVRKSLEEIPGCVDVTSSFENSHASITANLDIYGGVTSRLQPLVTHLSRSISTIRSN